MNAPDDFYGESSMSPRARAAKRRRERLASSASGTTSPDAVDRNYRDPVQQLHDTSSQLLTQREVWVSKGIKAGRALERAGYRQADGAPSIARASVSTSQGLRSTTSALWASLADQSARI